MSFSGGFEILSITVPKGPSGSENGAYYGRRPSHLDAETLTHRVRGLSRFISRRSPILTPTILIINP